MPSDTDYILPSSDAESLRLEAQAHLYGGTRFLEGALSSRPASVLDVGCGTGFFARHVAQELPEAQVVGVDLDEERLVFARAQAAGLDTLELMAASMTDLPFEDGTFDLVYARLALLHQPDPAVALREMARVTRPGGTVLSYDMVHDGVWLSPPRPAFQEALRQILALLRDKGIEPDQGLHVPGAMVRAGLGDIQVKVDPVLAMAGEPGFATHLRNWIDTLAGLESILGEVVDPTLVERAIAELEEDRPDQLLLETVLLATGVKSAGP